MKICIGAQRARGEASKLKKANQHSELDLIEAFIDICTAPADIAGLVIWHLQIAG